MKQPALRVVAHRPGRRAVWIALWGGIAIGLAVGGYQLGAHRTASRLAEAARLEQAYAQAQARVTELERRVADVELSSSVDAASQNQVRETIKGLRDELAESREELRFYRQLMAPSAAERGLRVERLDLVAQPGSRVVDYRVLLTHLADRQQSISGTLRIDVAGLQAGAEQVLSLTDLGQTDAYPLSFKFRYFQDFAGTLTLPAGFVPSRVVVTAETGGKDGKRVERTFTWTLEEG